MKPVGCPPFTDDEYDVFEPALFRTEGVLKGPPRGDEELDDVLACACICGRAGSRSVDTVGRGAYCEEYHDASTGPREWTWEIDGSSSFPVLNDRS